MTVTEIGNKSSLPSHFESDGTHAYIIDNANHDSISIVNLLTGVQKESKTDTSKLGVVVNTTLSALGDGMFILTDKPSVWYYRFSDDTITEQTLAYGSWPKASAIASYASNLYLLGDGAIYKQVHNATGYSPKTDYISTTSAPYSPAGLAVDGYVYVVSASSLSRYLGTSLKDTANVPTGLGTVSNLRSEAGGDVLIGVSSGSNRIGIWSVKSDKLTFTMQIAIADGKNLHDAVYDKKTATIYATIDNRFVSFPIKL